MPKPPRKHHYIPQFYSACFTDSGLPNGKFYVFDKKHKRQWTSTPANTGHKRDYHSVDLGANVDPMGAEKKLAVFEGRQNAVLRGVRDARSLRHLDNDQFAELMGFVALMIARVPAVRERIEEFIDEVSKKELFAIFSTAGGRATARRIIGEHLNEMSCAERAMARKVVETDGELENIAAYVAEGGFDVSLGRTWDVQTMLDNVVTLAPLLALRNWALWIGAYGSPDFVCSDHPVSLNWLRMATTLWPPGFGAPDTVVSVPVNRRMALVGTFAPMSERRTVRTVGTRSVAVVNASTIMDASKVFSANPDFVWLKADGTTGCAADLLGESS